MDIIVEAAGEAKVVATLERGNIFGETSLLKMQPRNATVRAADDLEVYALDKASFLVAVDSSISFRDQLLQFYAARSPTA